MFRELGKSYLTHLAEAQAEVSLAGFTALEELRWRRSLAQLLESEQFLLLQWALSQEALALKASAEEEAFLAAWDATFDSF